MGLCTGLGSVCGENEAVSKIRKGSELKNGNFSDIASSDSGSSGSPTAWSCGDSQEERFDTLSYKSSASSPSCSSTLSVSRERSYNSGFPTSTTPPKDRVSRLPASDQITSVRARYAAHSQAGFEVGGTSKENQDAWCVREFPEDKDAIIFGVFDGHGEHGHNVAQKLARMVPDMLVASDNWKDGEYVAALNSQIPACSAALSDTKASGVDCALSGSTGVIAVLQSNRQLIVGNLGDSRCFIGGVSPDGNSYSIPLTTDHTPELASEARRIHKCKGWIGTLTSHGKAVGPKRIFVPGKTAPGLSMTRAFGDTVATTIGLSAQPDIVGYQVKLQDRYLVLCSDGLFEFMSNEEVIGMVHMLATRGKKPSEIANFLVTEARRLWAEEDGDVVDDCTVIVALLDTPALTRKTIKTINLAVDSGVPAPVAPLSRSQSPTRAATRQYMRLNHVPSRIARTTPHEVAKLGCAGYSNMGCNRLEPGFPRTIIV